MLKFSMIRQIMLAGMPLIFCLILSFKSASLGIVVVESFILEVGYLL